MAFPPSDRPGEARPWRVGELLHAVKTLLETEWPQLWVEGEVAQVSRPPSGHVYFSLADEGRARASLPCVMYAREARRHAAVLQPGERVQLRGRLSMYVARGAFQLVADRAQPAGAGSRRARLEALKRQLAAEGLFDPARKRPLPRYPRVVGVVTSRSGAALHDVLRVSTARAPVRLVVADCRVQGEQAPESIVAALRRIQRLPELDVILLVRGGGSSEDLSAFDEETVVRAVAAARVPVVSGVGHEVDVSLCDLAADVRAATPSNAAELAVPDRDALATELRELEARLGRAMDGLLAAAHLRLRERLGRLGQLRAPLRRERTKLHALVDRLQRAVRARVRRERRCLLEAERRLRAADPQLRLRRARERLHALRLRLHASPDTWLRPRKERLATRAARLQALSPLDVLGRGYALVWHEPSGRLLRDPTEVHPEDTLRIRLHRGSLRARVLPSTEPGSSST